MKRLIYNIATKKIIAIIDNCEGTITGTPFDIFEGTENEVQEFVSNNELTEE